MTESNAEKPLTPCDLVVLATIAAKPRHGYELWRALEDAEVKDWAPVSRPQIYYSLKKLDGLALISAKTAAGKPAGPKREVFAATRAGRAALKKNLAKPYWSENREPPPFMTWAALSLVLSREDRLRQLRRRRRFIEKELARERVTLKGLERYHDDRADLARALIGLAVETFKVELSWLDKFEKSIKANP